MSLKIEKKNEGTKDTVMLSGRLDTTTAPELDVLQRRNWQIHRNWCLTLQILSTFHLLACVCF